MSRRRKKAEVLSVIDDIFNGSVPAKTKKTEKETFQLPDEYRVACDVLVASRVVSKAMESKARAAEDLVKDYAIQRWCTDFVKSGKRPNTCTYQGENGQFDFVQTSKIELDPKKIQDLKDIGIDIGSYITTNEISIDMNAIRKLGLEEDLKAAIASVIPEEHLRDILFPKVTLQDSFFGKMLEIAKKSISTKKQSEETLIKRLRQIYNILRPIKNIRNPMSSISDMECFTYVESVRFEEE